MLKKFLTLTIVVVAICMPMEVSAANMNHQKAKRTSPFLIASGLPHYAMVLKKRWDDPKLSLTPDQKKKLAEIRKVTMSKVMSLKPKIIKLQKRIVKSALRGAKPQSLKEDVELLAKLKAKATRIHLKCIYDTRQILTSDQLEYLNSIIRHKHR